MVNVFNRHLGQKREKQACWYWLGEDIGNPILASNREEFDRAFSNLVAHKVTADLYVFCSFMKYEFEAMGIASWLSQNKRAGAKNLMLKSCKICWSQTISLVVTAKTLYSVSAEDRDTVDCFFAFQENKNYPCD